MKPECNLILNSAVETWNFLRKNGGINTRREYDAGLLKELKLCFSTEPEKQLRTVLKDISVEDFIVQFFETVQPYSSMISDILRMFEEAGVKESNQKASIRFDFNKSSEALDFQLSSFKEWLEVWDNISESYSNNDEDIEAIWNINDLCRELIQKDEYVELPGLGKWLYMYEEIRKWPQKRLCAPQSEDLDLNSKINSVWEIWERITYESSRYGEDRDELMRFHNRNRDHEKLDDMIWLPSFLSDLDYSTWSANVARGLYSQVRLLSSLASKDREKASQDLSDNLDKILSKISGTNEKTEKLVRHLQTFLQLPWWKYRHELYSVWVCTQISETLKDYVVRFHHSEGVLKFSFSGSHLATIDSLFPRLHIWSELSSSLDNPIGKGRKRRIQPDYSLVADPISEPESSIFVIECKQYIRPSRKNFSNALIDYARGRPNAHVALVDYGEISDKVKQGILDRVEQKDATLRHRVSVIGKFRPGESTSQRLFGDLLRQTIDDSSFLKKREPS